MSNLRSLFRGRSRALVLFLALPALVGVAACQPPKEPPPPPPPCTQPPTSTVGPIDFESPTYSAVPGSINNQDGWKATGLFDQAVVLNSVNPNAPDAFGDQSWRVSNAVTSGSFGDQPFSKPLVNEAGESTAENAGQSGGTRQPCFKAEFTVASNAGANQNGLRVTVSPDRGDGARMSFVSLAHTASDLNIRFFDVDGVTSTPPCFRCANFRETDLGNFDETQPHKVRIEMQFVEGDSNDVVKVFVDDVLEHVGKSWEDYYRLDTESSPTEPRLSRTVDSLLFRLSGTAVPTTLLNGFLFEGVKLESGQ
jgi:hypothetical protein